MALSATGSSDKSEDADNVFDARACAVRPWPHAWPRTRGSWAQFWALTDLTRRCSEPRPVLMPSFFVMRTSFLARAVADLGSR